MVKYDMLAICQTKLSFRISYFLFETHSIAMSDVSSLLGVSDYMYLEDAFSRHDGI